MPLEPLQLDDLTWSDLSTAARDRIAGASRGQWTLHAPVDPGITLLELFASQLEQRLYWMNQPSEELDEALLKLHGEQRKPVQCAKTVLSFQANDGDASSCVDLKRHTVVTCNSASTVRRFRTKRRITILPFQCDKPIKLGSRRQQRIVNKYQVELRHDLNEKQLVQDLNAGGNEFPLLLTANQAFASSRIRFAFCPASATKGIRLGAGKTTVISIFIELDVSLSMHPQWQSEELESQIDPPTKVHWQLMVTENGTEDFDFPLEIKSYVDGTNGLRNSGVIYFRVTNFQINPNAKNPLLELRLSADTRPFTFAPRVKQIVPNAVIAEHRQSFKHETDALFHKLPGNQLDLPLEMDDFLIPDKSLRLKLTEKSIGSENGKTFSWFYVSTFAHVGSQSRVFIADREQGKIAFGNGLNGRIPIPVVKSKVRVRYDVGGGAAGNVTANTSWTAQFKQTRLNAINVVPASGGAEAETVDQASRRFRTELRKANRAITREDMESLAIETPRAGIARAHAVVGLHPNYLTIPTPGATSLFVIPDLPASLRSILGEKNGEDFTALQPDHASMQAVSTWLSTKRLLTQEIFVCRPQYEEVDLFVTVQGTPFDKELTDGEIRRALQLYLHPLTGGPEERGWPFGGAIRPSELMRHLDQSIAPELRIVEIGVHKRPPNKQSNECKCEVVHADSQPTAQPRFDACNDTLIGKHSLVALRSIQVKYSAERRTGGLQ